MTTPAPLRWVERRSKSPLHEPRLAGMVGMALGSAFIVCFATGVLSHLVQHPPTWFEWPSRPAGLYRVTQGIHVTLGFVSIPLLLAKLWIVYPKLFERPAVRSLGHGLERLSLLPLVGGGLFMVASGTFNVARWYPWGFFFPLAHYWIGWVTIGALVIHLGAKWSLVRSDTAASADSIALEPDRRRLLTGLTATAAVVFVAVAGNTIRPISKLAILAQRRPGTGPQGIPINKSAAGAGVSDVAISPSYRLIVEGAVSRRLSFSLDELRTLPQRSATLPIACVEGWSSSGVWTGVRIRDLLDAAGVADGAMLAVESLQKNGLYRRSDLNSGQVDDRDTLLALQLNGEPLHLDHGYPVRLIAPNLPGVMQTKWVTRLVVS